MVFVKRQFGWMNRRYTLMWHERPWRKRCRRSYPRWGRADHDNIGDLVVVAPGIGIIGRSVQQGFAVDARAGQRVDLVDGGVDIGLRLGPLVVGKRVIGVF